ncbi:two-component sensor histidine kinase [Pseudomonas fluorescens]|uniref:histidine kinase n=1 Tax=Pseudomonas fluorescens TaxID=294 RepID=A0A1T2Z8K9_PSEFL|nr:HAMP domain-containing sensor histidine kinase [Pseudomonas fluorescens]OPB00935.1 two-component sensor histidine kinase [Pseudomonas fluorescens]
MNSLRRRMMRVLCLTIGICWALTLALLLYTQASSRSSWDSKLQTIATKLLLSIPQSNQLPQMNGPSLQLRNTELADTGELTFQVWAGRDRMAVRAPGAPATALQVDFQDGFSSPVVEGRKWRVYSISDSTGHIFVQVGNLHSVIDAEMRRKAFLALGITTTLLALLGLLMWQVLGRALLPVLEIENVLRGRRSLDLTPLPVVALPRELQPLVEAFNHLLGQLDQALEGERRFIGNAAHELRTPLAALQAHAQIALRATTLAEKDTTLLKLQAVAQRSTRLSEQLLDLARLDASNPGLHRVRADLNELIGYVADEFEVQAVQQQRIMQLCVEPCLIDCDIDEIGILLRNLIDNALRYTEPGGRVNISCGESTQGVYLHVADDGPGVPVVEQEMIFDRFHRVSGTGGRGSGIGLSLVKSIAKGHDARILVGEGLDGKGLAITVYFPPLNVFEPLPPIPAP